MGRSTGPQAPPRKQASTILQDSAPFPKMPAEDPDEGVSENGWRSVRKNPKGSVNRLKHKKLWGIDVFQGQED